MPKRVCIISLALPIEIDPRTSRHVELLSQYYQVTLIGYGSPRESWTNVLWRPIDRKTSRLRLVFELMLMFLGRIIPTAYQVWFRTRSRYRQALTYALASKADVFHASDWAAIYVAVTAAQMSGGKVFFDADEYWPLENETSLTWRLFFSPLITWTLRTFASRIDAATTVSQPIAERYKSEFGLDTTIVYNAPDSVSVPAHETNPASIKLIHHGAARRNRYLEMMIDALAQLDDRFSLHFMLVDSDRGYSDELRQYADRVAPRRVFFRPPVSPFEIVNAIADCDIGLCFIPPTTYTYRMTLPNKLFEFIMANQAVVSGPSPAMAEVVEHFQVGWVTAEFTAQALAAALRTVTIEQIETARTKAHEAAKILNAENELNKLLQLYQRLLDQRG